MTNLIWKLSKWGKLKGYIHEFYSKCILLQVFSLTWTRVVPHIGQDVRQSSFSRVCLCVQSLYDDVHACVLRPLSVFIDHVPCLLWQLMVCVRASVCSREEHAKASKLVCTHVDRGIQHKWNLMEDNQQQWQRLRHAGNVILPPCTVYLVCLFLSVLVRF